MNNKIKIDRHNFLMEQLRKIEEESSKEKELSPEEQQEFLIKKTKISDEIIQIRRELKINTSTIIDLKDICIES